MTKQEKRLILRHATSTLHELLDSGKADLGMSWGKILVRSMGKLLKEARGGVRKRSGKR